MPFVEAKIVDPKSGQMVVRNTVGELCIRSYGNIRGYWQDPAKSAEILTEDG
jgi:fatty-acyl-CoA synthase